LGRGAIMIKLIEKAVKKGSPVDGVVFDGIIRLTPEREPDEWVATKLSLELEDVTTCQKK